MLEQEQEQLLIRLVEAARSVPREDREFAHLPYLGGQDLMGPGNFQGADYIESDLTALVDEGLLRATRYGGHGEWSFVVAPEGFAYYEELKAGDSLVRVEEDVMRFLDAERFSAAYPVAHGLLQQSAELLWGADSERELTTIGHKTREAVQAFTTALVERHGVSNAPDDAFKTVARLRAVIEQHRDQLGEARRHLLDALVSYWGEVNDLLQRQEHGGQKEGEPLTWEDGRRAVFHTAIVMYEIDRTLETPGAS